MVSKPLLNPMASRPMLGLLKPTLQSAENEDPCLQAQSSRVPAAEPGRFRAVQKKQQSSPKKLPTTFFFFF